MHVYALWHGGDSYSSGSIHNGDLEWFESLRAAKEVFRERYESSGRRTVEFCYIDRPWESTYVPAVNESASMDIYTYDPRETDDPYPDFRLSFGPRMGIVRESY